METNPLPATVILLFAHTDQGAHALRDLLAAGVDHASIRVIGDLGLPAGSEGAEHHVTFDALHLPAEKRTLFMDSIRSGGVVLALREESAPPLQVEKIGYAHNALSILHTTAGVSNPSHNPAS